MLERRSSRERASIASGSASFDIDLAPAAWRRGAAWRGRCAGSPRLPSANCQRVRERVGPEPLYKFALQVDLTLPHLKHTCSDIGRSQAVFNTTHPYLGDQEHAFEVLPVRLQNVDDVL